MIFEGGTLTKLTKSQLEILDRIISRHQDDVIHVFVTGKGDLIIVQKWISTIPRREVALISYGKRGGSVAEYGTTYGVEERRLI